MNLELGILNELLTSREGQFERLNVHLEEETGINLLRVLGSFVGNFSLSEVTEKIVALDGIVQVVHF